MREEIRVVLYGVGTIGRFIAEHLFNKKGVRLVGVIAQSDEKRGKDLGDVFQWGRKAGIAVSTDPETTFAETRADIVLIATLSRVEDVYPHILAAVKHGVNVITASEEMFEPFVVAPRLAREIDSLAREYRVTVVASGIIPGFLDLLTVFLTTLCADVHSIRQSRTGILYPRSSESLLLRHMGIGASAAEFDKLVSEGVITGHQGGPSSIAFMARALDWRLEELRWSVDPVLDGGKVKGTRRVDIGIVNGKEAIVQEGLVLGPGEPGEAEGTIEIKGTPDVRVSFDYKSASPFTAASMVNLIPHVINAEPGIKSLLDLPITHALLQDFRLFLK